ncbi:thiamine pyrophosphate-dependent enzyme [Enterovirga sp.]|jgi:acetolactate synthase-1/2/3 large subunit|uniref:thiamine pyrophosphate-dependent enzyme n=1 Tax=Enterovirga sp. TaxID=2026350 RepID=UPI002639BDFD|nr:thiamine pyrophosphate-dependent enzyme [Enterovirga sp.]MDB5591257.1 thiamine pyrophosphate-binding protein [Enterovirga sp.]
MTATTKRTRARLLVEQLRANGVDRVFCVPGESFLAVLDAMLEVPEIQVVTCRQEGGAVMMAEAYGKLTGRPGVAFVTRGPGATNGSAGVHIAHQDSTPLILFIGHVERAAMERGAFQEIDYRSMFASFSKFATVLENGARLTEIVQRSFALATSGRPGPVVIALPEDMLIEETEEEAAPAPQLCASGLTSDALAAVARALAEARAPVVVVGGGGWSLDAAQAVARFAAAWNLPVAASFRCQDYMDNGHPNYVGNLGLGPNPALLEAVRSADVVLAVGARLGELTSNGYTLLDIPAPRQRLIHIHADPDEIGRVYQPALGAVASSASACGQLAALPAPAGERPWAAATAALRASYLAWTDPPRLQGDLDLGAVMRLLRERLPADAIVANGAGNFAIWPNRYHRYRSYRTMLAPMSGSMGYGVPAAISAKLQHPDRTVVAFTGDGDALMTGQELATAVMMNTHVVIILINNGMYGTIRMHQERDYPGRVSATGLVNPDFAQLARSFGASGTRIERTDQFAPAFDAALAATGPVLLELMLDPEVLSPTATVTSLRAAAAGRTA